MRIWIALVMRVSPHRLRDAHSLTSFAAPAGLFLMLPPIHDYDRLYREFRWPKLARYNIGVDVCDKWAAQDPNRLAILNVRADGGHENITFGWLRETSNRLANALSAHGVARR